MTFGIYLGALLVTIIGCHLYRNYIYDNKNLTISIGNRVHWTFRNRTFIASIMVILSPLLLVYLRYGIGGDYFNYKIFYEQFLHYGYSQFEPLTEALMKLNHIVFHDGQGRFPPHLARGDARARLVVVRLPRRRRGRLHRPCLLYTSRCV